VALFDGNGGEFTARLVSLDKRRATVELHAFDGVERESPLAITLVQALATSDKMDLIVQKAVELGAVFIQPVASERATLKLSGDRADKRAAHWQAIARAACEQCGRNRVPVIGELMALADWLALPVEGARFLMHPRADASLLALAPASPGQPIHILVGPEGGFSEREIAMALERGVKPARFGPRVLRTETAGLAVLAALNALSGDLK
jgi:16S rRNA (uracil1498-N3)-methyltransferase